MQWKSENFSAIWHVPFESEFWPEPSNASELHCLYYWLGTEYLDCTMFVEPVDNILDADTEDYLFLFGAHGLPMARINLKALSNHYKL